MPLKPKVVELTDVSQTSANMYRIARAWKDDIALYATLNLQELFDFLRKIPYNADPDEVEFLQRPYFTISESGKGGDCDDKAICVGAWCELNGHPYYFEAVSTTKDKVLHHVLTNVYYRGRWIEVDPTYSFNVLGRHSKPYTNRFILRR